jgi:tRNA-2-methylthio-N6-dimethylallyladenosine synthase
VSAVAKKYFIETMGCQMNVHDSERMAGLLEAAGYEPAGDIAEADCVVLNTCSVRERAEEKLFSRLGELRVQAARSGGHIRVAVAGCVAQQDGARILRRAPFVDVVAGTHAERRLPMLIANALESGRPQVDVDPYEDVSFPLGLVRRGDPVRAYVTIIEGCNDACSFCVVPHTRGRERMRPKAEILEEVREAAGTGHREIQLLGQIVNHYRAPDDPRCDFAGLLEAIHEVPGVRRIRFASPHPRHVTPRLIEAIRDLPRVCKHLHVPVQSGSTRILEAMRRRHTREQYLELVAAVREQVPAIALSTDMIVGFPGETTQDFQDTLTLTATVRYHSMFSFAYSARPHTLAWTRMPDDVAAEEKARRLTALQALQREIQTDLLEQAVGTEVEVLVDSLSRRRDWELSGRTLGNTVVNFPGTASLLGQIVGVRVRRAGPNSLWGELARGPLEPSA